MKKKQASVSFVQKLMNFTGIGVLMENRSAIRKYLTDKNFRKWVKEQDIMEPFMHMLYLYTFAIVFVALVMFVSV